MLAFLKKTLRKFQIVENFIYNIDNFNSRRDWVRSKLQDISPGSLLLDAGCGTQQYKPFAKHLNYRGQDFGQYKIDAKKVLGAENGGLGGGHGFNYGKLDYVGDIWDINEEDGKFDVILCTEVLEHIPYPIETIEEFSRLLKLDGKLILTFPSNCLRHMDPYYFTSGFSDRWVEYHFSNLGLEILELQPIGDYYSWLYVELYRSMSVAGVIGKTLLIPAFLYFYNLKKSDLSIDTTCMGYHVLAQKKSIKSESKYK